LPVRAGRSESSKKPSGHAKKAVRHRHTASAAPPKVTSAVAKEPLPHLKLYSVALRHRSFAISKRPESPPDNSLSPIRNVKIFYRRKVYIYATSHRNGQIRKPIFIFNSFSF